MSKKAPFSREMELLGEAMSEVFSPRVLAWQLGGTIVAAFFFAIMASMASLPTMDKAVGFVLYAFGFVVGYVILCLTGTVVTRNLERAYNDKTENSLGALHFLVDNIATATLLPLAFSAGAVVLAALSCFYAYLWSWEIGQRIMVFFTPVAFVLALLVVTVLFLLLFIAPSMVVTEQPSLVDALRRIRRLLWTRKMTVTRIFGPGLAVAVIALVPVMLIVFAAKLLCAWIYAAACGVPLWLFTEFILSLFGAALLWAPILAAPLVFLNALSLVAYGKLTENLDTKEQKPEPDKTPAADEKTDPETRDNKHDKEPEPKPDQTAEQHKRPEESAQS